MRCFFCKLCTFFGLFLRKRKRFYLLKSIECKNVEAQYLKIAQNTDRTLEFKGGDLTCHLDMLGMPFSRQVETFLKNHKGLLLMYFML